MKNTSVLILITLLTLLTSCGDKSKSETNNDKQSSETQNSSGDNTEEEVEMVSAICLWPKVGLRDKPGRKNTKYLTTIYFGETVEFLNQKKQAEDNKEYIKIKLSDGTEGWAYEYLFSIGGKLGIVKKPFEIYKRPDIMTFEGKKLNPMDMVVLSETTQQDWFNVVGFKKEKKGWIQNIDNLLLDDTNIKMGILYRRALDETETKKYDLLENIVNNPNFKNNELISYVNEALYEDSQMDFDSLYEKFENLPSNKLGITANTSNVRSEPKIDSDNVVFQIKQGSICTIVAQGESLEEINDNMDRWYKINYDGQEGWVFGYNTTKRRN
ncbi:MAG: SH3 domain-containing protein [Bacteroidota bacterium]